MEETLLTPFRVEPQELAYNDRNRSIQRVVARFHGFAKEYFVSDHGQRAALVTERDGNVLLTRQYRLIINGISHEIPGGGVKPNESPATAAARECFEETGVHCSNLQELLSYHLSLDICRNPTHIFFSEDCDESSITDTSKRVWVSLEQCVEMVFSREIVDSLSIIALFTYYVTQVKK